ncbi:MAG: ATP-binding protein [Gammaproteobacteria bacterium]|nr:ATP-binding protein [Gammaproteobacteria bacterium]
MAQGKLYERHVAPFLQEALQDSPAVLIHGPRQCGKSTLALQVGRRAGYDYISFDDDVARLAAMDDPAGFVSDLPDGVIIDEVQHVPDLFSTLKLMIDRRREPGRFLLTGSSNLLLLPALADSLAGRMQVLRLHPLSQTELARRRPEFLDALFARNLEARTATRLGSELADRIVAGGYPPALLRPAGRRRANWYIDYVDAVVQRDVRDLARISAFDVLPQMLRLAAAQTSSLFNLSALGAPFRQTLPTITDYFALLERVFLVHRLPPWHNNRTSRLVKAPKLHVADTGVACALLGADAATLRDDRQLLGQLLETFVLQELRCQAACHPHPLAFFHYRDKDKVEVDIVIDAGSRGLAGVEVKAGATVRKDDFRGLRKLQRSEPGRFVAGVVLYDGEMCASFGEGLYAVPIRLLWDPVRVCRRP